MRFPVVFGLIMVAGSAMADLPDVPTASPPPHLLNTRPQAQCAAPASIPDLNASSGPVSLSFSASANDQQNAFYRDLSVVATQPADGGRPTVVLRKVGPDSIQLEAGARMRFGIPDAPFNLAFMLRNRTRVNTALSHSVNSDLLWSTDTFAIPSADPAATDTMLGNGQTLTEAGMTMAHAFGPGASPFRLNAAFTARRQDLFQYNVPTARIYGDPFLNDASLDQEQGFNFNAGLTKSFRGINMAVTVDNLFPRGMNDTTDVYGLRTTASVGTRVDCGGAVAQLNIDWHDLSGIGMAPDQRYAVAGMALGNGRNDGGPKLHLGYRRDLIDNLASVASLGVGFSPFSALSLDISGTKARGGSYGVMARLGLKLP